jgi:cytochrome c-type biogenesis protein CcmF
VIGGVILFGMGYREIYSVICFTLCIFVAATILMEFYRGANVIRVRSNASFVTSAIELTLRNTRRYGGYIVHMGMVLIFVGLAGAAFNKDVQKELEPGQSMQIGKYSLLLQNLDVKPEANFTGNRLIVEVFENGKPLMMLYPERRVFETNQETGTMVAIYSTLREDLYVVYAGQSPGNNLPVIHAYLNPLVKWIWFGGVIVVFGTIVALMPNRREVLVLSAAKQSAAAPIGPELVPNVTLREGHD